MNFFGVTAPKNWLWQCVFGSKRLHPFGDRIRMKWMDIQTMAAWRPSEPSAGCYRQQQWQGMKCMLQVTKSPERDLIRKDNVVDLCSIVGIAMKYPGQPGLEGFWRTAVGAGDVQSVVPYARWEIDLNYSPDTKPGRLLSSTRCVTLQRASIADARLLYW